jgi:6-pyruvoyltetrahydropterin/6-carboxytetrahydropterin synthase
MFRISKRFAFEAAHHLAGLPEGHKCSRPHGHSYTAELQLAAPGLDECGFVTDFADLVPFGVYVAEALDHRVLNEVLDIQPSSEGLARHLHEWCSTHLRLRAGVVVEAVRVSETATTWAEYRPGSGA